MRSLILITATRYLLPLMLLFSVFILFRGHHNPGGGFIGGLIASAAFALYGFAHGMPEAQRVLRVGPIKLIGIGLATALLSALFAPAVYQSNFLTAQWSDTKLPGIGTIGTPLFFDVGVYITVVGVTLLIMMTLAEGSDDEEVDLDDVEVDVDMLEEV